MTTFLLHYEYIFMPRNPIASVEIVEPPIGELTKKQSSFKRTCFTGCIFIVIFIVFLIVGIRFLIGDGPETVKTVPAEFPTAIPVYDKDAIERITYVPGKYKYRSTEIAAFFPKIILSPLLLRVQDYDLATSTAVGRGELSLNTLWRIISTPVSELKNTIQIEWRNIEAEPSFVFSYYRKELSKKGFVIENEVRQRTRQHFSFYNNIGISGFLVVEGDEEAKPGTDYAVLTVNIPLSTSTKK